MRLFDPEGPLMSALGTLADLMFCNILFCLFSLPLVTIGASLTALYDCTFALAEGTEDPFLPAQFWRAFRHGFAQSTALWLAGLAGALVLWAYQGAVAALPEGLSSMYRVTFFVLVFLFLAGFQYVFPVQALYGKQTSADAGKASDRRHGKQAGIDAGKVSDRGHREQTGADGLRMGAVLKTAWLISAAALPWSLCMLAVTGVSIWISFFLNPAGVQTAIFLWAVAGFGVVAYLHSFPLRRAFRRWEKWNGRKE